MLVTGYRILFFLSLLPCITAAQYRFDQWTTDSGLPQNSVRTIVRTRDGYLWMGTFEGLVRFDGVDFTVFDLGNTKELTSNYVRALIEDRDGNLWIGIDGGALVRYKDHKFQRYSKEDGLEGVNLTALHEDPEGKIWIGSEDGGVSVFSDGRFTNYSTKDGLPSNLVRAITGDESGRVWVATDKGVASFHDGKITVFEGNGQLTDKNLYSLHHGSENKLWVGSASGLNLVENGELVEFKAQEQFSDSAIHSISEDNHKNLWVGTNAKGLYRINYTTPTQAERLTTPDQSIVSIYHDLEDQIWVGTFFNGLLRFTNKSLNALTSPDFQLEENAPAVFEDREGGLWFIVLNRIYRLKEGIIKDLHASIPIPAKSFAQDREGSMWFASNDVHKFSEGKLTTFSTREGLSGNRVSVYCLIADRDSGVWFGTYDGLHLIRDGQVKIFRKEDGLAGNYVLTLYEDRAGAIWIGTADGLSRYKDGQFTNWTTKDGLADGRVSALYEDGSGAIWISSQSGLNRLKDGKFSTITTRDGLFDNLTFKILEDDTGNLWMSSNRGIYRTSLKELNDFADGVIDSVRSYSYGKEDGMLSRECNGGGSPGVKTRDGRLWFPTIKGLVEIDPKTPNSQPPEVFIERSLINENILPANNDLLEIKSGEENLEIKYTAISWRRPSQIKFKYRLEGLDPDWVDVGTRRTAYFSYLPPGEYTFKVIADNGEGVWNMEGNSLKIMVLPPFYRTWWFSLFSVLIFAVIIFGLVKRRFLQLKRERTAQQAFSRQLIASQEQERKRIAAELHDSLGQRLVVIKNLALMFLNAKKGNTASDRSIEDISAEASQAIGEVKEISYNLRPYQLDRIGLTKAVQAIIRSSQAASMIEFSSEIDDIDDYFPKDAEINFYRIVQECVNNLVKHSEATRASVKIKLAEAQLDLEISDNGIGFTPGQTESNTGGFGLTGIVERAEIFGGNVEIQSAPQQGTVLKIRLNSRNFLHDNK